jgi:hypothetical protein
MGLDALEEFETRLTWGPIAERWARELMTAGEHSAELRHRIAADLATEVHENRVALEALLEAQSALALALARCYADALQLPLGDVLSAVGRASVRSRPPDVAE